MSGAKIALTTTDGELQKDTDGNAKVNLPKVASQAGYAALLAEIHDGATGKARTFRSPRVTLARRLKVGLDVNLWDDRFNGTNTNSRKYNITSTTMNTSQSGGAMALNGNSTVATAAGVYMRTYKTFPINADASLAVDFTFAMTNTPVANNEINVGLALPGASATVALLDGVYMQIDSAGTNQLVSNFNGAITAATFAFTWVANRVYEGRIVVSRDGAELWIDDALVAVLDRSSDTPTAGALSLVQNLPLIAHMRNTGALGAVQKLLVYGWSVQSQDLAMNRTLTQLLSSKGDTALSTPDSVVTAMLANIANSAAPTSATLSNTAAGYTTLGGNFQFAAVAGAETDYALFAYQVPALGVAVPGKGFLVQGIEIDTFNMGAAVATTATLLNWYIGIGDTAVSLATADAATSRASHRQFLGAQSFPVGAAVGARADRSISVDFSAQPLFVEPGTYIHIILRMPVGTATASQIIRGGVTVKGHFK